MVTQAFGSLAGSAGQPVEVLHVKSPLVIQTTSPVVAALIFACVSVGEPFDVRPGVQTARGRARAALVSVRATRGVTRKPGGGCPMGAVTQEPASTAMMSTDESA